MTDNGEITVSREELYEQVWITPMRHLAKRYCLSDVGLRKCCVRHDIPTPPAGYWAQKAVGKAPQKPSLPPLADQNSATIRFGTTGRPKNDVDAPLRTTFFDAEIGLLAEAEASKPIRIPSTLRNLHPMVEQTRENLMESTPSYQIHNDPILRSLRHGGPVCFDVRVSKGMVHRAICILTAIVTAVLERGYSICKPQQKWNQQCFIDALGCGFELKICEKMTRCDHVPTAADKKRSEVDRFLFSTPKWDFSASGRFEIEIHTVQGWAPVKIRDGKNQKVEDQLHTLTLSILSYVDNDRKRIAGEAELARMKVENDRIQKQVAEQARQAEEIQRQEDMRVKGLLDAMESWHRCQRLRAYLAEVRRAAIERHGRIDQGSELDRWLSWANDVAVRLDPLSPLSIPDLKDAS